MIRDQAIGPNGRESVMSNQLTVEVEQPYVPPTLLRVMGTGAQPVVGGVAHNDS